jgi:hypothetical protein
MHHVAAMEDGGRSAVSENECPSTNKTSQSGLYLVYVSYILSKYISFPLDMVGPSNCSQSHGKRRESIHQPGAVKGMRSVKVSERAL